jgi:hypothetical protein
MDGEPAVIVCGRTRVMLGFAASCAVEACCTLDEQPRIFKKREKLALTAMALKTLPKIHPRENQTCQPEELHSPISEVCLIHSAEGYRE